MLTKPRLGEGVKADVALGDDDEAAQSAAVLLVLRSNLDDQRLMQGVQAEPRGQVVQYSRQPLAVAKTLRGRSIAVDHVVGAEGDVISVVLHPHASLLLSLVIPPPPRLTPRDRRRVPVGSRRSGRHGTNGRCLSRGSGDSSRKRGQSPREYC